MPKSWCSDSTVTQPASQGNLSDSLTYRWNVLEKHFDPLR